MLKIPQACWLLTSIIFYHIITCEGDKSKQPHIIFILADDLAINDVGFRNPEVRTPTIDKLASESVLLNYMYAQPSCTMSRAALLTGRYPHTMGIENVFDDHDNRSIPVDIKLLPQYLKDQGYQTHMIGKWHVGMCDWSMTPTRRGFDTFSGCLHGNNDHYLNFQHEPFDFWSNETIDHSVTGEYDTEVLTQRTVDVIVNHRESGSAQPLFIYLAYKAVHKPIIAPDIYKKRCHHIEDPVLRERCAMLAAVDDGIKNITDTLDDEGYLDEPLLLIFMSDNGGSTPNGASNWPLRGKKATPFEGGTRVLAFVHSRQLLPGSPRVYNGLLHITDWLPTLLTLANSSFTHKELPDIDGLDQWRSIKSNKASKRDRLVYQLWEEEAAVRVENFKLVYYQCGKCYGWLNPPPGVKTDLPEELPDCTGYMLFDLDADPDKKTDLSNHPKHAHDLKVVKHYYKSEIKRRVPPQIPMINANMPAGGADWEPGWCRSE